MAFNMQNHDDGTLPEQHDINVTPFIDVMLVLLIIFMVAAPLATVSVPVDLPSVVSETQPSEDKPLYLTIQKDMTLTLDEDETVMLEGLANALTVKGIDKEKRILLRADSKIEYGDLMSVMNQLGQAGYLKIALVGLEQTVPEKAIHTP